MKYGADVHIASLVVQCRPQHQDAVIREVATLPEAEVAAAEGGKLVVVVEAASERRILDLTDALRDLPQVLGCHLVYHHAEPAADLAAPLDAPIHELEP